MLAAYGFRFTGLRSSSAPVGDAEDWPIVHIESRFLEGTESADVQMRVTSTSASLRFPNGSLEVDRATRVITFHHDPPLDDEAIIHPFLAFPAAVLNHWYGRSAVHAGALIASDDRTVVLLGDKGAGKSTTVAAAALAGHMVLADDLVVLDGQFALSGPRSIDLRDDAALLTTSRSIGHVGGRQRWRVDLPPAPARTPIGAMVALAWGPELVTRRIEVAEAAQHLFRSFALERGPGTADHFFELLAVPMWEICRPRNHDHMPLLLDRINHLRD